MGFCWRSKAKHHQHLWAPMHWRHYCRRTFRFCRHYAVLCELLVGLAPCPQTHPTIEEKKAADSVPQGISQPDHSSLVFSKYHEPMRLSASTFSLYQTISNPQSFNLPVLWHCVLVDL